MRCSFQDSTVTPWGDTYHFRRRRLVLVIKVTVGLPRGLKRMKRAAAIKKTLIDLPQAETAEPTPLWQLDIEELAGHNIEARGREEVNRLLSEGWILLHIYTLKYEENGVWRERPMAILGRPRKPAPPTEH